MNKLKKSSIDLLTAKAIKFIIDDQNNDGSFASLSAEGPDLKGSISYLTTFYSSLILQCLTCLAGNELAPARKKISKFLKNEKSEISTYNYWARKFKAQTSEHYPDDLDDTSCAFAALFLHDKKDISEIDLANFTKILIKLESQTGGPYYTWVMPEIKGTKWADVDLAVNANIGYFLFNLGINLPTIEALIDGSIKTGHFDSPYYYSKNAIFYFISRFYAGKNKDLLIERIKTENQKNFENPLEAAFLGLSLLNLGVNVDSIKSNIDYLISKQNHDGSFGAYPCALEFKRFSGSKAFTTALVLEFFRKYRDQVKKNIDAKEINSTLKKKEEILNAARELIEARFPADLVRQFDRFLGKIASFDHDGQIILHPHIFIDALKESHQVNKNKIFLRNLAIGSIFGWYSYTIFDNIIDEKKDLDKLFLAIICNRELERLFCENMPGFQEVFLKILDRVDYANFYESNNALFNNKKRIGKKKIFPSVDFIAEKSIVHCLVPLAIMQSMGYEAGSSEYEKLFAFYRDYLVARQLNDDAHDWEEDLKRGQINYAAELLLTSYAKKYGDQIDLSRDLLDLRKLFWQETILEVCDIIKLKIRLARENLKSLDSIIDQNLLSEKLGELEGSADKALSEREKTIIYIDNYFAK